MSSHTQRWINYYFNQKAFATFVIARERDGSLASITIKLASDINIGTQKVHTHTCTDVHILGFRSLENSGYNFQTTHSNTMKILPNLRRIKLYCLHFLTADVSLCQNIYSDFIWLSRLPYINLPRLRMLEAWFMCCGTCELARLVACKGKTVVIGNSVRLLCLVYLLPSVLCHAEPCCLVSLFLSISLWLRSTRRGPMPQNWNTIIFIWAGIWVMS